MIDVMLMVIRPLQWVNDIAGRIGRALSVFAIAVMVIVILTQVFFRYVLNNALPWPDEAARFMMLWLTGLMAPVAMRQGGMVAISSVHDALADWSYGSCGHATGGHGGYHQCSGVLSTTTF